MKKNPTETSSENRCVGCPRQCIIPEGKWYDDKCSMPYLTENEHTERKREKVKRAVITFSAAAVTIGLIVLTSHCAAAIGGPQVENIKVSVKCDTSESLPEPIIMVKTITEYTGLRVGDVICGELTAYCACATCCGTHDETGADGAPIQVGDCACNWLPLGSVIRIDGAEYTVSDRGAASWAETIGRIDIYCDSHDEAAAFGRQYAKIEIVKIS